jgi:hypothetical protein
MPSGIGNNSSSGNIDTSDDNDDDSDGVPRELYTGGSTDDSGDSSSGGSPGGSSPPPSDIGGADDNDDDSDGAPRDLYTGGSSDDNDSSDSLGGGANQDTGSTSPSSGGSAESDSSPGGSSPPPSDVGGPGGDSSSSDSDSADSQAPGPGPTTPGGLGSDPSASGEGSGIGSGGNDADGVPRELYTGGTPGRDSNERVGPGPGTRGGLGSDPNRDDDYPVADAVARADADQEVVDRLTKGGVLSERGGSAGLLPAEISANTPRGKATVDVSETRAREFARDSAAFGDDIDVGAAFSSPASPLASGGTIREGRRAGSGDPANENLAEEFVEGGARVGTDLPAGLLQAETATEVAQSAPGTIEDEGAGTVAETGAAVGRNVAAQTADEAQENPAEFAGGVTAGLLLGAGAGARGTGSFRAALRAEVDPRVGPFGTTIETRAGRGLRDFLSDDRGQMQIGKQRSGGSSSGESSNRGTSGTGVTDTDTQNEDLGPNLGPFDNSDSRLRDPTRTFDQDTGGMAPSDIDANTPGSRSRDDIDGGVSGEGNPQMAPGVEADSFSDRGFGDYDQRFDRRSDDRVDADADATAPILDPEVRGAIAGAMATGFTGDATGQDQGPDLIIDTFGRPGTATGPLGGLDTGLDQDTTPDTDQPTDTDRPTDTDQPTDTDTPFDFDLYDPDPDDPTTRDPDSTYDPNPRDIDRPDRDRRDTQRESGGAFSGFGGGGSATSDRVPGASYFNEFVTAYAVGPGPRQAADESGGFGFNTRLTETQATATGETRDAIETAESTFFVADGDSDSDSDDGTGFGIDLGGGGDGLL